MIEGEIVETGGRTLIPAVYRTTNMLERARGLLGRRKLEVGQAMLLIPCGSIHTIGMRYSLDVVFLDREGRVVKTTTGVRPLRIASARGAESVLEMPKGGLAESGIRRGMELVWREKG